MRTLINLICVISIFSVLPLTAKHPAIEWENTSGSISTSEFQSIQQTIGGSYIIGGSSVSNAVADKSEEGRQEFIQKLIRQ